MPSLEGDMKIFALGRHEFSGQNKSSCLPTNWAIIINCLLYRKLKEHLSSRKHALNRSFAYFGLSFWVGETWHAKPVLWCHSPSHRCAVPWDTTGRHDDLSSLHVTSLDQSYFFIRHINYMRYINLIYRPPFAGKGRLARNTNEKLQYVGRQFLAELGLSQWRSREFWGMLLMFIIVFFIRTFMHYIGQWLFLSAINIPINKYVCPVTI